MAIVIGHHRVKNVTAWKPFYDDDLKRREKAGIKQLKLGTKDDDPNDVYMVFDVKDPSTFKGMINDPELRAVMDKAGVISVPEFFLINEI